MRLAHEVMIANVLPFPNLLMRLLYKKLLPTVPTFRFTVLVYTVNSLHSHFVINYFKLPLGLYDYLFTVVNIKRVMKNELRYLGGE